MALKLTNPQFKQLTSTPQRKTYTVALATLAVVALLVFFAIRPAVASIFDKISENKENRATLERMDEKYDSLINLGAKEQSDVERLGLLEESFPTTRQEEFIIANLSRTSTANNLELTSITVDYNGIKSVMLNPVLSPKTEVALINFTLSGTRANIVAFIEDMESFPRPVNFTEISMKAQLSESGQLGAVYAAQMGAEIYYFNNEL